MGEFLFSVDDFRIVVNYGVSVVNVRGIHQRGDECGDVLVYKDGGMLLFKSDKDGSLLAMIGGSYFLRPVN
jgi:hypothetical protein